LSEAGPAPDAVQRANEGASAPGLREHAVAQALCLALLTWTFRLWQADLRVPFAYEGDALFTLTLAKSGCDVGSFFENPRLGAPFGLQMYDHPVGGLVHFALLELSTLVGASAPVAVNLHFLLGFPLTTATALFALGRLGVPARPAVVAALLFAFLPYHFVRGETHLFLASYYVVPLAVLAVYWCARGEVVLAPRPNRRGLAALAVMALTASANVYYALFTGVLLLVHGGAVSWRARGWRPFFTAAGLCGGLTLAFALNIAPSLAHFATHGRNPGGVERHEFEAELYGLRPGALVLPMPRHRLAAFRQVRAHFDQGRGQTESDAAALGIVASCGCLGLLGRLFRRANDERGTFLAESNLALLLLGAVGSAGALVALFVTPLLRAYARVSIFIGFFALAWVAERLGLAHGALTTRFRRPWAGDALLGVVLWFGILDQTSPLLVPAYAALSRSFAQDRAFVRALEASLPSNAAVFVLPYVAFPEGKALVSGNDLTLGYQHAERLGFSAGAMNGSYGALWQESVASQPPELLVRTLALAGFGAVYVDRRGMRQGDQVEVALARLLGHPLVNERGDLAAYLLDKPRAALRAGPLWAGRASALELVVPRWSGFYDQEERLGERWRWSGGEASLEFENPAPRAQRFRVSFQLNTATPTPARLRLSGLVAKELLLDQTGQTVTLSVSFAPGTSTLRFEPRTPPVSTAGRLLSFAVRGLTLEPVAE
jgi:phosphoglycerol transferase